MATEDIAEEEIVGLAKPYLSLIPFELEALLDHCHHCLAPCFSSIYWEQFQDHSSWPRMSRPLPCTVCSNVIYCSDACRLESWNAYHKFECGQLPFLYATSSPDDTRVRMALRLLYSAGSVDRIREAMVRERDNAQRAFDLSDPIDYSLVFHMAAVSPTGQRDLVKLTLDACMLTWLVVVSGFIKVRCGMIGRCF